MATSASRARIFPARSRKSYRLEMESRTLYLLLSLMALTGVVIFYLGIVTGKAIRDPNAPVTLSAQMGTPAAPGEAASTGPLAYSDALKGDQQAVEGLRAESKDAAHRTEALLSEANRQLELREVTPATPPAAPRATQPVVAARPTAATAATAVPPVAPRVTMPSAATVPDDGSQYTVQVFSSQREESARGLVARLRNQGFSAYLNRFEAADRQVWYRVRVGKTDHAGAEALRSRLKSEANLKNPQIQKL